jgi:hypothetical protein
VRARECAHHGLAHHHLRRDIDVVLLDEGLVALRT